MPEGEYGVTGLYMALRACERFGIDPMGESPMALMVRSIMDPGTEAEQILAYNRLREAEHASELRVGAGI